jgi:serine/threonine protein kinase
VVAESNNSHVWDRIGRDYEIQQHLGTGSFGQVV